MTTPAHSNPLTVRQHRSGEELVSGGDKWQQWRDSLRRGIADRKNMRDAQVDGDDLHGEYQDEITFMTRQLRALEENVDRLRAAETAVSHAQMFLDARDIDYEAFGTRCGTWRNVVGVLGVIALFLCFMLDDVPGFIVLVAVLGLLAAAGLHTLAVMGGGGRATKAQRAADELRARVAELHHLEEQILRGVRDPQPLAHDQPGSPPPAASSTVSLFPQQRTDSQSTDRGSDQSANTRLSG